MTAPGCTSRQTPCPRCGVPMKRESRTCWDCRQAVARTARPVVVVPPPPPDPLQQWTADGWGSPRALFLWAHGLSLADARPGERGPATETPLRPSAVLYGAQSTCLRTAGR